MTFDFLRHTNTLTYLLTYLLACLLFYCLIIKDAYFREIFSLFIEKIRPHHRSDFAPKDFISVSSATLRDLCGGSAERCDLLLHPPDHPLAPMLWPVPQYFCRSFRASLDDGVVCSGEQMRLTAVDTLDADGCHGDGLAHLLKPRPLVEALSKRQTAHGVVAWPDAALVLKTLQRLKSSVVADPRRAWFSVWHNRQSNRRVYTNYRLSNDLLLPLLLLWWSSIANTRTSVVDVGGRHFSSLFCCTLYIKTTLKTSQFKTQCKGDITLH